MVFMPARFVCVDHDTPLLRPPDLRDRVAPDHMVHFVMDAVDKLKEAKEQMEMRAKERLKEQPAEHAAKLEERAEKQKGTDRKPAGRELKAPEEGPREKDQYNFTDPESRIMKHRGGFEQAFNAQAAVAQVENSGDKPVVYAATRRAGCRRTSA